MQELRNEHLDGVTQIYVTGPSWPKTTVNVNGPNPWSKEHWNLTAQATLLKRDRAEADRLAQVAGHKGALSARFETAK
jgi:hypothetical protein